MHLSDADLGTVLDRSGGGAAADAARRHAAACNVCDDALRELEGTDAEIADALRALDHLPPPTDLASMQARWAEIDRRRTLHVPTIRLALRRSAMILALGAAAAAAAVPRSPIRRFIAQVVSGQRASAPAPRTAAAPPIATPSIAPPSANAIATAPRGVAIAPARRAAVLFRGAPLPSGSLHVREVENAHVAVTADTEGATYTVGRNTITVDAPAAVAATYDIDLPPPSRVPDVDIRVGNRIVYSRHAGTVVTAGARQSDGSYLIPMR